LFCGFLCLPCVADADIIFLSCGFFLLSSVFFLSSPNLSGRRLDTSTLDTSYFYTWRGLSANLECRSEVCGTRLHTIPQLCRALSSQLRHASAIEKKLLNSNISSTCLHSIMNVSPLVAEICWRVWGTPANFNGFGVFASLLHRRRSTEVNKTLHFGGSCFLTELCAVQN